MVKLQCLYPRLEGNKCNVIGMNRPSMARVARYNPHAVLGGIFQDVIETIAQNERSVVSSKGKVINN